MTLRAHATIHDVRPDTLDRVEALLGVLGGAGRRVALLVVPGLDWSPDDVSRLRSWASAGYELAGHGWVHRRTPRTAYHRLHARVVSRDQAEHLSASRDEVRALVARGREWFDRQDLPAPSYYVPPAWALGSLLPDDLSDLGYRVAEVQWGYLDLVASRFLCTPLIGFEADTWWRQRALGVFNAIQVAMARRTGRPLRLGLHPFDLELRRASDVGRRVGEVDEWMTTAQAVAHLRD
jgi:peptidoglycan/xylan/chitin deacetylase (PgdA/CDA1 family)